ncbi:hypothetical protein GOP47_0011988, partial [Adiantum capillus-veneris]
TELAPLDYTLKVLSYDGNLTTCLCTMCLELIVQPVKVCSFTDCQTTAHREELAAFTSTPFTPRIWSFVGTLDCSSHQQVGNGYTKFQEELRKRDMLPTKGGDGDLGETQEWIQAMQADNEQKELPASKLQNLDYGIDTRRAATLVASLKACAKRKDLDKGSKLHADIVKMRLHEKNHYISSALISMYAKCGALEKAQEVFDELPDRNVVSWNALIAGYVQHGQGGRAMKCFEQMNRGACSPDRVTLSCILRACGSLGALDKGQEIHTQIASEHLFEKDVLVSTALVDMYAKCGSLGKAQEVFNELPVRNVVSWTALIAGYAQHKHGKEALYYFEQMQHAGVPPNAVTFACVLKACGSVGALQKGEEIHGQIVKNLLLDKHVVVANAVIDMYAKCGALEKARDVFDKLIVRDIISWNALITGYTQQGHGEEALKCFDQMLSDGFSPDATTYAGILKACGSIGALDKGQEIHGHLMRQCLLEKNAVVANALVDMYAKCGALEKAEEFIHEVQTRDIVAWTALIAGYVQHGRSDEALNCYEQLQLKGLFPDAITFACILKACGNTGFVFKGQEIHADVVRRGSLESVMAISTALVDMYANFGLLMEAQESFNALSTRDVASWSALMVGYSQLGKAEVVFHLLEEMIEEGAKPDLITCTIILNTCSHEGCLEKGQMYFEILSTRYGIFPHPDHYTCMIDLFGRAGHLHEAVTVIEKMSLSVNLAMWISLLGGCKKWGNIKLGSWVFEHAKRLDGVDHEAYVCLSNIYAEAAKYPDARRSKMMRVRMQG